MKSINVATKNILAGRAMVVDLLQHARCGQRLGLIVGPAGSGKTTLAREIVSEHGGVLVRARQTWTIPQMLGDVLDAVSNCWGSEWHSAAFLYRTLLGELKSGTAPLLLVDEADYLARGARHDLLNTLRDLSDEAEMPIIFFSVNVLAWRLAAPTAFTETVTSRIGAQVEFRRLTISDARLLAVELLEDVELASDVLSYCLTLSGGVARRLMGLYGELEAHAKRAGERRLTMPRCLELGLIATAPAGSANVAAETDAHVGRKGMRIVA